ncbi:MAG: WecB/TagA/CpsF family glycosyltransferase [Bacteroidetes bacterium]|nr:WecB/TagA/CpsF family glycosyltransferase [Bacteroidota bacterium]MCW5896103.1 WecB/TagA/CpsF family glycosyltransferase [Bacteroidota bacterium]
MHKVDILGVRVDVIDTNGLHQAIEDSVRQNRRDVYSYVNINAINIAQENERFKRFLNNAHVVYCDGEGVRLGARMLGYHLPPRVVLTYWIWELCELFEKRKFSVFFLGATKQFVDEAVGRVRQRFPGMVIAGSHHGYFEKTGAESETVVEMINSARPNVLIVGFGMPVQEMWIEENYQRLAANVILPAGSMIDYTAGRKGLAPKWMANNGMEWLYRFFQEPGRLWKRYLIGNPSFMYKIVREYLVKGTQR